MVTYAGGRRCVFQRQHFAIWREAPHRDSPARRAVLCRGDNLCHGVSRGAACTAVNVVAHLSPRPCSCSRAHSSHSVTVAHLQGLLAQLQQDSLPACRSEGQLLRHQQGEDVQYFPVEEEGDSQRKTIFWGMAALQGPHGDHHLLMTTSPGYEVRAHQSYRLSHRLVTTMPTCFQQPLQTENYALLPETPADAAGNVAFRTYNKAPPGERASMEMKWYSRVLLTAGAL